MGCLFYPSFFLEVGLFSPYFFKNFQLWYRGNWTKRIWLGVRIIGNSNLGRFKNYSWFPPSLFIGCLRNFRPSYVVLFDISPFLLTHLGFMSWDSSLGPFWDPFIRGSRFFPEELFFLPWRFSLFSFALFWAGLS